MVLKALCHQLIDFSFKEHNNIYGKEDIFGSPLESSWLKKKNFGRKLFNSYPDIPLDSKRCDEKTENEKKARGG